MTSVAVKRLEETGEVSASPPRIDRATARLAKALERLENASRRHSEMRKKAEQGIEAALQENLTVRQQYGSLEKDHAELKKITHQVATRLDETLRRIDQLLSA